MIPGEMNKLNLIKIKLFIYFILCLIYWQYMAIRLLLQRKYKLRETSKLCIVPCEPRTVIGSRGDEAMITAIVHNFYTRHPSGEVVVVTGYQTKAGEVKTGILSNARIENVWSGHFRFINIFNFLRHEAPSECYILGADCMDGYYSVWTSMTLLMVADLATRFGIPTRITGFSFNESPSSWILFCFRLATSKLLFRLRDPVSLQRFMVKTGRKAELVADVAFLLRPMATERTRRYTQWAQDERMRGQRILGFNVHGLLFSKTMDINAQALDQITLQLHEFLQAHGDISCLLIPHDYRSGGDLDYLLPIYDALLEFNNRVSIIQESLSAAEIKEVCGVLDGVFTSRMHLAIAALGMVKPVSGFGYQGKFEGCLQHFNYTSQWILKITEIVNLMDFLKLFMGSWTELESQVNKRLPDVLVLAGNNFTQQTI